MCSGEHDVDYVKADPPVRGAKPIRSRLSLIAFAISDTPEQKLHNALLSRIRIVVENTLAEMKHVRILTDVFRHPLDPYDRIFVPIAGVVTHCADQHRAALPLAA